jgi:hypothetical protein
MEPEGGIYYLTVILFAISRICLRIGSGDSSILSKEAVAEAGIQLFEFPSYTGRVQAFLAVARVGRRGGVQGFFFFFCFVSSRTTRINIGRTELTS